MIDIIPSRAETEEQYHASGCWGSTLISHFIKSPLLAHWMRIGRLPHRQTPAMRFGTMFHRRLDPSFTFDKAYRIGPDADGRSKAWKDAEVAAKADGAQLVTAEDAAALTQMVEHLRANATAATLLEAAEHEVGFRVACPFGPYRVQCRADVLHRGSQIVDIKTTTDLDAFSSSVVTYGYARQAALYRWVIAHAFGEPLPFAFIVSEKQPPFRCRVVELSEEYLNLGWRQVERALHDIGDRYLRDDWSDRDHHVVMQPPEWLVRQEGEAIEPLTCSA